MVRITHLLVTVGGKTLIWATYATGFYLTYKGAKHLYSKIPKKPSNVPFHYFIRGMKTEQENSPWVQRLIDAEKPYLVHPLNEAIYRKFGPIPDPPLSESAESWSGEDDDTDIDESTSIDLDESPPSQQPREVYVLEPGQRIDVELRPGDVLRVVSLNESSSSSSSSSSTSTGES